MTWDQPFPRICQWAALKSLGSWDSRQWQGQQNTSSNYHIIHDFCNHFILASPVLRKKSSIVVTEGLCSNHVTQEPLTISCQKLFYYKVILTVISAILEMGYFYISSSITFFSVQALVQLLHIHIHPSHSLRSRLQEVQIQIVFKFKLPLWFHHIKPLLRSNLWNEKRFLIQLPQMGYNSPGPESCRIRNSQTPLTHPCTHMQPQTNWPSLHALLTNSTPNKPVSKNWETLFSFPLSDIKEQPYPQDSQLCPCIAGLIFLIRSNDLENWAKFVVTEWWNSLSTCNIICKWMEWTFYFNISLFHFHNTMLSLGFSLQTTFSLRKCWKTVDNLPCMKTEIKNSIILFIIFRITNCLSCLQIQVTW